MTLSELKAHVGATGSKFFTRESMRFFGDTMRNYKVLAQTIDTPSESDVKVYALIRKRPVKNGLDTTTYFRRDTFERTWVKS